MTDVEVVNFFESAVGVELLHRMCVALHLLMGFQAKRGIREVGEFLE